MATFTHRTEVGPRGLDLLAGPMDDAVVEEQVEPGRFVLVHGPCSDWARTVQVEHLGDGRAVVDEHIRFRVAAAGWGVLFVPLLRRSFRRRHHHAAGLDAPGSAPDPASEPSTTRGLWWSPPERLDARAAHVLGALCTLSVVVGYLGTVITQTITFAASRFGSTTTEQSGTLAAVRVGVLASLAIVALADRRGRRRLLLASTVLSCATAALGALSPGLVALGVTQTVSRALSTSALLLLGVVAAEEMPAGSRAFAVSVTTLTAALGAGICVWFLPLADIGRDGWRLLYALPLLAIPVVVHVGRTLPESRRFVRVHAPARLAGHGRRLWLLGAGSFLAALFAAPASQLQNQFLRHERGFTGAHITVFTLLTATPAGVGVVVGGRIADRYGRRLVGALGSAFGAGLTVVEFFTRGWPMWLFASLGIQCAALAVPALGVYGPELFPTGVRGKANGVLQVAAVAGSSVGLVVAGLLTDRLDHLGPGMLVLLAGPLLLSVLVVTMFPETAHRELEELNPEDAAAVDSAAL